MIINGVYIPLEDDVDLILDIFEAEANSYVETSTLANIRQSLNALGYDVDTQADRVNSLVNVLIITDEWDVDSAVDMMEALGDGYITELEVNAILGVDSIPPTIIDRLDDGEKDTEDELDRFPPIIIPIVEEPEDESSWIESITEDMFWSPLGKMLVAMSLDIGERLEKFIANAIGVEREE